MKKLISWEICEDILYPSFSTFFLREKYRSSKLRVFLSAGYEYVKLLSIDYTLNVYPDFSYIWLNNSLDDKVYQVNISDSIFFNDKDFKNVDEDKILKAINSVAKNKAFW